MRDIDGDFQELDSQTARIGEVQPDLPHRQNPHQMNPP